MGSSPTIRTLIIKPTGSYIYMSELNSSRGCGSCFIMEDVMVNVALDAMGGDNAPKEVVFGALDALNREERLVVHLCGDEKAINECLNQYGKTYPKDRVKIVHCSEVIEMAESPVNAIRKKKDSSIVVGMNLCKNGTCDAFVSAGSTGAILVGGQIIVGRIKGVERAPLAPLIPTKKGASLLIDCGASVDARPSQLVQFAKMGSIYMENIVGIKNPTVGIVNIGAEEEKGNALVKETFPLLKECKDINFIGSVEAREIPGGACDVIVTEAFTGNVILKFYEGVGKMMKDVLYSTLKSSIITMIGALLIKSKLSKALKKFDSKEYGGAPLLGLNGLVLKTHGSSKANEIMRTLLQSVSFVDAEVNKKINEKINAD